MTDGVRAKLLPVAVVALLGAAPWAFAQVAETPARELAMTIFETVDTDGSGDLSPAELDAFRELIWASMDADENKSISLDEFKLWSFGYDSIAEEAGRQAEFETVRLLIFDLWDRDNDLAVSSDEMAAALLESQAYADLNGDGVLQPEEFMMNYLPNVAYRAALGDR